MEIEDYMNKIHLGVFNMTTEAMIEARGLDSIKQEIDKSTVKAYYNLNDRCNCKSYPGYKNYGGRGIKNLFESYVHLYLDIGNRPNKYYSLDRIDTDGNYEPGNLRWATAVEQCNNRTNNVNLEFRGVTKTMSQWAYDLDINVKTLHTRLNRSKWSVERALTTPAREYKLKA